MRRPAQPSATGGGRWRLLTIHVFQDPNNDGVQQTFEPDVPRAEGTVTYGASSDTTVDATIVTNAAGKASIISPCPFRCRPLFSHDACHHRTGLGDEAVRDRCQVQQ